MPSDDTASSTANIRTTIALPYQEAKTLTKTQAIDLLFDNEDSLRVLDLPNKDRVSEFSKLTIRRNVGAELDINITDSSLIEDLNVSDQKIKSSAA